MRSNKGYTLIELLIVMFIMGVAVMALFGLFVLSLRMATEGERHVIGMALANERMEMIRNLPYADVGTQGGVPPGSILPNEQIVRNSLTFAVKTNIKYIDDSFDGLAGGGSGKVTICHKPGTPAEQSMEVPPESVNAHLGHGDGIGPCGGGGAPAADVYNADYKQARVEVSWTWQQGPRSVLLVAIIAPPGYEGSAAGGTLDFYAMGADGQAVPSAEVTLYNDTVSPPVNLSTQTNAEGRLVLPGLPVAAQSYELTVDRSGYTSESTHGISPTFIPDADHLHLSAIQGEVTAKVFMIDRVARLNVITENESGTSVPNLNYSLKGTKTIGMDGSGGPVLKVNVAAQTGAGGAYLHDNLEWDNYSLAVDGTTTGYDIKETSWPLPHALNPADEVDLTVTLAPHSPISLQVTVVDADGLAIDNATVRLTGPGINVSAGTGVAGQVFFANLPANGSYSLEIDAPGYESRVDVADVAGTSFSSITMAATNP